MTNFAQKQKMQSLTHLLLVRAPECIEADGGVALVPVGDLLPLLRLALLKAEPSVRHALRGSGQALDEVLDGGVGEAKELLGPVPRLIDDVLTAKEKAELNEFMPCYKVEPQYIQLFNKVSV